MTHERKSSNRRNTAALGLILFVLGSLCRGQDHAQTIWKPIQRRRILVSIPDRKLAVIGNGRVLHVFNVAVGSFDTPTPAGTFEILTLVVQPTYFHSGVVIPPGANNPVGTRWMGISQKGYGIHGTNDPQSIGKAASHGCIRLRNRDIEQLFAMVHVHDTVEIRPDRDQSVVAVFDQPANLYRSQDSENQAGGQ